MPAGKTSGRDWRFAADYSVLAEADRTFFAWEWLRRDPAYRDAARRALGRGRAVPDPTARQFGLVAFEDPSLAVPEARPLWRCDAHPLVLVTGRASGGRDGDSFDLRRLRGLATLVSTADSDHLLLSDGLRAIRLDGPPGTFAGGRMRPSYRIEGVANAEPPLLALRRFLALCRTGSFSRSLHRREPRSRRWIALLRTWDALHCGASQREIAEVLLSRSVAEPNWRSRESSIRSQVQRLVRSARRMGAAHFRDLLQ